MPRIEAVHVLPVAVPLRTPTAFSTREVRERQYVLIRVHTDDDCVGLGFCYAGHLGAQPLASAVAEVLAPLLIGQDPHATEYLWQLMFNTSLLHGRTGMVMRGLSALDIALWDNCARRANLPLYRYLGSFSSESVPAYASGGYYWPDQPLESLGREMAEYVEAGFTAVKMKVGRLNAEQDGERIRIVRDAIGPQTRLMLDANNAWHDVETAERAIKLWEQYDPYWIEEPFIPENLDCHTRLTGRSRVPVATGELEAGRWRFLEVLKTNAATILQPDAAVCGGVSEFRKIVAMAGSYGVSVYPHWFHDLHAHLVASSDSALMVEFFPDSSVLNFRDLLDKQLLCENGSLVLPKEPGLGFTFDESAQRRFAMCGPLLIR